MANIYVVYYIDAKGKHWQRYFDKRETTWEFISHLNRPASVKNEKGQYVGAVELNPDYPDVTSPKWLPWIE